MKELKRKQEEEELRRREEASRFSAASDTKTDGEKSETQSIKSAGNLTIFFVLLRKILSTFSNYHIGLMLLLKLN